MSFYSFGTPLVMDASEGVGCAEEPSGLPCLRTDECQSFQSDDAVSEAYETMKKNGMFSTEARAAGGEVRGRGQQLERR